MQSYSLPLHAAFYFGYHFLIYCREMMCTRSELRSLGVFLESLYILVYFMYWVKKRPLFQKLWARK